MFNITTEQMRFWSPEVRELEPYVPGEQPKIQNLLKYQPDCLCFCCLRLYSELFLPNF